MERKRRGFSEKLIINSEVTKKPADWKLFLKNDDNKEQLIKLIHKVWSKDNFAENIGQKKIIMITSDKSTLLTSPDGETVKMQEIPSLHSTQEETDTRVVLYCAYAKEKGYQFAQVNSPDSDVFFILLSYALSLAPLTILFKTGKGNNKRLLNISEIAESYGQDYCTSLLSLHAFTHCDTTSALKGKGKLRPLAVLQRYPKYQATFLKLGTSWEAEEQMYQELEEFTCALYEKPGSKNIDKVKYILLKKKCKSTDDKIKLTKNIDFSKLPPCKKVLHQHINRVNYQIRIWRLAHIHNPDIPDPNETHGWILIDGILEPFWCTGNILPDPVADLLDDTMQDEDGSDESDDDDDDGEFDGEDDDEEGDDAFLNWMDN